MVLHRLLVVQQVEGIHTTKVWTLTELLKIQMQEEVVVMVLHEIYVEYVKHNYLKTVMTNSIKQK